MFLYSSKRKAWNGRKFRLFVVPMLALEVLISLSSLTWMIECLPVYFELFWMLSSLAKVNTCCCHLIFSRKKLRRSKKIEQQSDQFWWRQNCFCYNLQLQSAKIALKYSFMASCLDNSHDFYQSMKLMLEIIQNNTISSKIIQGFYSTTARAKTI